MDMEEAWKGICYDDGTGRNVLYVDVKGQVINPYLTCTSDELFSSVGILNSTATTQATRPFRA